MVALDLDDDEMVNQQEFTFSIAQWFERLDRNVDGALTEADLVIRKMPKRRFPAAPSGR